MGGGCKGKRVPKSCNRRFMNAVFWMTRSGSMWDWFPEWFGRTGTIKQRFFDWVKRGEFDRIIRALNVDLDIE